MRKIVFIREGQWGGVKREDYLEQIESLKDSIERAIDKRSDERKKQDPVEVEVVETLNDFLQNMVLNYHYVVIFISRGMLAKARELKNKYSTIKVIVLSGAIEDSEVILLDKAWLTSEVLQRVLFLG